MTKHIYIYIYMYIRIFVYQLGWIYIHIYIYIIHIHTYICIYIYIYYNFRPAKGGLWKSAKNADLFELFFFVLKIWIFCFLNILNFWECMFVFLVCLGLYIDVLSVSMKSSVIFCIYEPIWKNVLRFSNILKKTNVENFRLH